MKHTRSLAVRSISLIYLVAAAVSGFPAGAASTGTTGLYTPQGSAAGTANGDFVTATAGLNTFYRYFIEVPPGLGHLVVEIFDADIGRGANEADAGRDRDRDGGGFNSTATYTLLRPDGTTAATLTCAPGACNDNAWQTVLDSTTATNTAAGHWELRVAMNGSTNINAIGIRAHDGTSGAGGTELNIYFDSMNQLGVNPAAGPAANTRSYDVYPYITSGCSANKNDFDYDSNNGTVGSINLTSRTAAFTQNYASAALSANNVWRRDSFSGWTSDTISGDYGVWHAGITIDTYTTTGINGNYTTIYFGNFQAAANPPTANPIPGGNGFRTYLPTDAGTAPSKPYVEQLATYSGCGAGNDGPNPPVVGQASCYTVTVRAVNPAAQAITFSAANLVTANVPGGGTVYAGIAQVSQGTVTAQPAVGGTGNVTWNPGTLAAGATGLLAYRVKVTPASAGQRIPITATPASGNGTRAQYLDETGNSTQARATFLFGPLCELAVTQGLLTQAIVSSFRALPGSHGGVVVEWTTASEAGTAGFRLSRRDPTTRRWRPVYEGLLAGLQSSPQGGTYRVLDEGAQPGEALVYRLEEVEAGGSSHVFGPYRVTVDRDGPEAAAMASAFERTPHRATQLSRGISDADDVAGAAPAAAKDGKPGIASSLWLGVSSTALHRLSVDAVATASGRNFEEVQKLVKQGRLLLRAGGTAAVPWFADLGADGKPTGIFFYGVAQPTNYSLVSAYRLDLGVPGGRMGTVAVGASAPAPPGSFADRVRTEQNVFAATVLPLDPESDYWFWQFLQGGDATFGHFAFPLEAPGATTAAATLSVDLQGATSSGVTGEHHLAVSLNGVALGDTTWTGITAQRASFAVPSGALHASGNVVDVTAKLDSGVPYSITYVNGFDLDFARSFAASADALGFPAGPAGAVVGGFSNPAIRLVDVTDPANPRWITGASVDSDPAGGFRLRFAPSVAGRFVATATPATPTSIRAWSAAPDLSPANLLIVAPASLRSGAQNLASQRQGSGLSVRLWTLEQVADSFGQGVATPQALRTAVIAAAATGGGSLRYLLLVGAGSVDYRNLLGKGGNLLPPYFVSTPSGLYASDNRYADLDGDHVPDLAVGRIPVVDAGELDAWVSKLASYDAAPADAWAAQTILLADAPDAVSGHSFAADEDPIAAMVAPVAPERIDLASQSLAAARSALFADLASGASLLSYYGHGGLDRFAAGGLLSSGDVPSLTNAPRLPFVTAMTCTVNRFGVPGIPSLGELLVRQSGGGAIAVFAPSGITNHYDSRRLAEAIYRVASLRGQVRLGDWLRAGYLQGAASGLDTHLFDLYNLLGDPTLRLHVGPAPPPTGGPSGE